MASPTSVSLATHPPRVGLDLLSLRYERTGMGQAAWWLAKLMPELAPDVTFLFFLPPGVDPPVAAPNVDIVRVPLGSGKGDRIVAEQWRLPRAAERCHLDILHSIAYGSPVLYDGVRVLTMHDLGFRHYPGTMPGRWRWYWNWVYGPGAKGCRKIVVPSEFTKNDVVRSLGVAPEKVAIVPPAAEPAFRPPEPGEDTRSGLLTLDLPPRFVLFVGTLQPRKDFVTLLQTFAQVRRTVADIHLVVSGGRGWGYADPLALLRQEGLEGSVHLLGFTSPGITEKLFRAAELLLFPSLYEGFGLPVLEAMVSGLPVVATTGSSIPEVAGDAALLAPPRDVTGLARHATALLTDSALRREMVRRGLERGSLFSWRKSAAKLLSVYRDLVPAGRRSFFEPGRPTNGEGP